MQGAVVGLYPQKTIGIQTGRDASIAAGFATGPDAFAANPCGSFGQACKYLMIALSAGIAFFQLLDVKVELAQERNEQSLP